MIVSVLTGYLHEYDKSKIKVQIENAVLYAISEGGKIFLYQSESELASVISSVIKAVSKTHPDITYMSVENKEKENKEVYVQKSFSKTYLLEKADILIVLEAKESVVNYTIPQTTLRIKI